MFGTNDPEKDLEKAEKLMRSRRVINLKRAIRIAEKVLKKNPNSARAWAIRGYCLVNMQNFEHKNAAKIMKTTENIKLGISYLNKAFELDESLLDKPEYAISKLAGQIFLRMYNDAIEFCDLLLQRRPNNSVILYYKASILYATKNSENALEYAEKAISGERDERWIAEASIDDIVTSASWIAAHAAAKLWLRTKDRKYLDKAMRYLDDATKNKDPSEAIVMKAHFTAMTLGDYDRALELLKNVSMLNLKDDTVKSMYHHVIGFVLMICRKHEEALHHLLKAYQYCKYDIILLFNIGVAYSALKMYREGLKFLYRAYAMDPTDKNVLYHIAHAHYKLKEFKRALEVVNQALQIHPHDLKLILEKGLILVELERYSESEKILKYTLSHVDQIEDPDDRKFIHMHSLRGLCEIYFKRGDYKKAIEYADRALSVEPNFQYVLVFKGASLKALGRRKEAKECLIKAYELSDSPKTKEILMRAIREL